MLLVASKAATLDDAMDMARTSEFDVALLDINLRAIQIAINLRTIRIAIHRLDQLPSGVMPVEQRGQVIDVELGPTGSNREEPEGSAEGGSLRAMTRAG